MYNLCGYLPAPIVYGTLQTMTGGTKSRQGMQLLMVMSIPVFFLLLIGNLTFENKDEEEINDKSLIEPLIPEDNKTFNLKEEYHSSESLENNM